MNRQPPVWITAAVLRTLGEHVLRANDWFTGAQLQLWMGDEITPTQRNDATSRLCALGFVRHEAKVIDGKRADVYTVTHDGAEAIKAAASGFVRKSGPKGSRAPNPVKPDALASRLWALVRMRRVVDSDTTASTLCNAGDDVERTRATVRKYLRRWCQAGALAEGARRVGAAGHSNGSKQYVLKVDSVEPPRWRQAQRQAAKGAAQ